MKLEEIFYNYKFPAFMKFWDGLKFHQKKWIEEEFEAIIDKIKVEEYENGYSDGCELNTEETYNEGYQDGFRSGRVAIIQDILKALSSTKATDIIAAIEEVKVNGLMSLFAENK